jgi:hypothetical protein
MDPDQDYCFLYLFYVLFADIKKKQILSVNIHKYLQVVQRQREASDQREPDIYKYLQVVQRQREASYQREPDIRQEAIFVNIFRLFNANVKQVINVSQIFAKKMIEEKIQGAIVNVSSQVILFFIQ